MGRNLNIVSWLLSRKGIAVSTVSPQYLHLIRGEIMNIQLNFHILIGRIGHDDGCLSAIQRRAGTNYLLVTLHKHLIAQAVQGVKAGDTGSGRREDTVRVVRSL